MILAETQLNWNAIGTLTSLAFDVIMVIVLLSNRSEKRVVSISPDATSKHEFDAHVQTNRAAHQALHAKIEGVHIAARQEFNQKFQEIAVASEASREKVHERINEVLKSGSELSGKVQGIVTLLNKITKNIEL